MNNTGISNKRCARITLLVLILLLPAFFIQCLHTIEPETGVLELNLCWDQQDMIQKAIDGDNANDIERIRITLMPGDMVFTFTPEDTSVAMDVELGIYNILVEAVDSDGCVVFSGEAQKILVEPLSTTSIDIFMTSLYPHTAPQFIGLAALNYSITGNYSLAWTRCASAQSYRLEQAPDSTFTQAASVYTGADTVYTVTEQQEGLWYYRVRGENNAGNSPWSSTAAFEVAYSKDLTITTDTVGTATVGIQYADSIAVTGGTVPYTWVLASGSLPAGLVLNTNTGVIGGMPEQSGEFGFSVKVTDSASPQQTAEKYFTIVVAPGHLRILTTELAETSVGIAYSDTVCASGGTPPYMWAVVSGSLPEGLLLDSITGTISGTAEQAGEFEFTVSVNDSSDPTQSAEADLIITVSPSEIMITTGNLPKGNVGVYYQENISVCGGIPPYTWTLSDGILPPGLSMGGTDGKIHGFPTTEGEWTFSVKVYDSGAAQQSTSKSFTLSVYPEPVHITTGSPLPDGTTGVYYAQEIAAVGGSTDWSWELTGGALPAGMEFVDFAESGRVRGTPSEAGTFVFTVTVSDNVYPGESDSREFTLFIVDADPPVIQTDALPDAEAGTAYSSSLAASGGTAPYTWSEQSRTPSGFAEGISVSADGTVSGMPGPQPETGQITVRVTDSSSPAQNDTKTFDLTINPGTLVLASANLPEGTAGSDYYGSILYKYGTGPLQAPWTITGDFPEGLSITYDMSNYQIVISGTPDEGGTYNFSVTVEDAASPPQTRTDSFSIIIN